MSKVEARNRAFASVLGAHSYESFADDGPAPTIEVRRYASKPVSTGPECDVWVTSGMSDEAMRTDDGELLRRELIFYAPLGGNYSVGLRAIAHLPFDDATYLDYGHSVQIFGALLTPNGARELATSGSVEGVALPHVLLAVPLIKRHQTLDQELVIDGTPVEFLWVIPISAAEHALKKARGKAALLDLFDERKLPWLFDAQRKSFV